MAVVGVPDLGIEAAGELGVALSRIVVVDAGSGPKQWAERVTAAADGFDLILTRPPVGADRVARKLVNRLQASGAVMVSVGRTTPGIACDIELTTTHLGWYGIGSGWGAVTSRDVAVNVGGRRVPRTVEHVVCLPGPLGTIEIVDSSADDVGAGLEQVG